MGQPYRGRHRSGVHRQQRRLARWLPLPAAGLLVWGLIQLESAPEPPPPTPAVVHIESTVDEEMLLRRVKAQVEERKALTGDRVSRSARRSADSRTDAKVAPARALVKMRDRVLANRWVYPVSGYRVTSGFGMRGGKLHPAVDLAVPVGTPVKAMSSGRVTFAGWSTEGYGYLVKIRHWNGTVTWYAHNSRVLVSTGDWVQPAQWIARSGNTGHSTGPHLHLEIHPDGGPGVSPAAWMRAKGIPL